MEFSPLRISMNNTCSVLGLSRNGLKQLIAKDQTFPRPIKDGISRQSSVFFDYTELKKWHEEKRQSAYH